MGFVVFFTATWLSVLGFAAMRKSLSFLENTVILLMAMILSVNVSWILVEELQWIHLSQDPLQYTAYLLHRSVLQPMIYTIWLNALYRGGTHAGAVLATLGCSAVILGLNFTGVYYQIYSFVRWNFWYDVLYAGISLLLLFGAFKLAAKGMGSEEGRI
ncbi:hypothetical protein [Gorillibacterium sp. sgz5001074]|uniref:hypothetical protein n=1 Tax=Gorillibacterium sp. sgz5001074 TaxID=3446695 RepID=UPI003F66B8A4